MLPHDAFQSVAPGVLFADVDRFSVEGHFFLSPSLSLSLSISLIHSPTTYLKRPISAEPWTLGVEL